MRILILTALVAATTLTAVPATAQEPRGRAPRRTADEVVYIHHVRPVRRHDPRYDDPRSNLRAHRDDGYYDDGYYYDDRDPRNQDPRSDLRSRRGGRYTADDLRRDQRADLRDRHDAPREDAEEDAPDDSEG
ncbi:hypothetical protein [Sphingomonas melonis]|uniref:Uncharacterized protein n=1 Tax=Sphingomonas melonis TaxID=152682 RepID=A0A7Y9FNC4_9SPHN|nr:hypothetical protein [Sphingomonas melonis]NYD90465.1 hypothetical protein [Sphingomonas melonis]